MVQTVLLIKEIPQLFFDTWSMSLFDRVSSTGACVEETVALPQLQLVDNSLQTLRSPTFLSSRRG